MKKKNEHCKKTLSGKHNFVSERADMAKLPHFPTTWGRSENTIYWCAWCGLVDDGRSFPNDK